MPPCILNAWSNCQRACKLMSACLSASCPCADEHDSMVLAPSSHIFISGCMSVKASLHYPLACMSSALVCGHAAACLPHLDNEQHVQVHHRPRDCMIMLCSCSGMHVARGMHTLPLHMSLRLSMPLTSRLLFVSMSAETLCISEPLLIAV